MKRRSFNRVCRPLVLALAGVVGLGALSARANLEVSAGVSIHATADFYAPLTPYGTWVEVGAYGRCWRPAGVAVEWSPYCVGHWVWTDCGWFWASDEPWAWACYHYGAWTYDTAFGWIWVPGIDWAPAWVTWRVGGGVIGWAPLPPRGARIPDSRFVFVAEARFTDPLRVGIFVANTPAVFARTSRAGSPKQETRTFAEGGRRSVFVNSGPAIAHIEKAGGRKLQAVSVQEAARQAAPSARSIPARPKLSDERPHAGPAETRPSGGDEGFAPREGREHDGEHQRGGKGHGKG